MEEQPTRAKRKHYEPAVYARLFEEFTRLIDDVPKLRPDRDAWDIEGDWVSTGTIYFIDAIHQPLFESIQDFDCRTIKLVNIGQPAARITFYRKHRYWLLKDKDIPLDEKITQIQTFINDFSVKAQILETKLDQMPPHKMAEAKGQIGMYWQQVQTWREILNNPAQYEIASSNYAQQHFYVTVNYKYRLQSGDYANEQEHLLNTQRDRHGNITQVRYNILFVDTNEILRDHPYQNREIEKYLNGFPIQSAAGRHTLYARLRLDSADGQETFQ